MRLLVMAKEPIEGRVKTRLSPHYAPYQAAALARAAIEDTLAVVAAVARRGLAQPVLVLDGRPGPWLPAGMQVAAQVSGSFDERLGAAFDLCAGGPALLIGMDTPQITPELIADALEATVGGAAFGAADDGGWWALGLARADGSLVRGVETSTTRTGAEQRARLVAAGLAVADLPVLTDVDTAADAARVARICPGSVFASRIAEFDALDIRQEGAA